MLENKHAANMLMGAIQLVHGDNPVGRAPKGKCPAKRALAPTCKAQKTPIARRTQCLLPAKKEAA